MPSTLVDVPTDTLVDPKAIMFRLQAILLGENPFYYGPQEMGPAGRTFWSMDPKCAWIGTIQDGKVFVQYNGPLDDWPVEDMQALARVLPKLLVPGSMRTSPSEE